MGFGGKPNRVKGRGVNRKTGMREERDGWRGLKMLLVHER